MYADTDTDPGLVTAARSLAEESSTVVVTTAAVTDTVKSVVAGFVADTVDRDELLAVRLPVVVPAAVAEALGPPGPDLAAWVGRVRRDHDVAFLDVRDRDS